MTEDIQVTDQGADQIQFYLKGKTPDLNDLIDAAKVGRTFVSKKGKLQRSSLYSKKKKLWTNFIATQVRELGIKPFKTPVFIHFTWSRKNRRTDPDNISSAGRKVILDGLVKAKVLENDGWKQITGMMDIFYVGEEDGVLLTITETEEGGISARR